MDLTKLKGENEEEIKESLLKSIMKTKKEAEKERMEKKSKSDLKIYLVKSIDFQPQDLEEDIDKLRESEDISYNFNNYLENHRFNITKLNDKTFGLTISTPEYKKEDDFIIFVEKGYWHIWTLARRRWTKKTIERLIDHHPKLDRSFINPEDLESLTSKDLKAVMEEETHFSGFVAKFKPYYSEKQVSINMYGGDHEDLEIVKNKFDVEPTQITVSMKNSPENCVLGNLHGNEGFISLSTILEGYYDWGKNIAKAASQLFENSDKGTFEIKKHPEETQIDKNGFQFTRYESYYSFNLEPQFDHNRTRENISKLFEKTIEWFLENKRGYYGYKWDEDTYHILRKENMDMFQLSKEEENLVLYPFDRCSEKTIRDVCKEINENIQGDVKPEKYSSEPVIRT